MKPPTSYHPLSQLLAWDRNPHQHPDEQVATLASAIRRFGFNAPPLLATTPQDSDGFIVAGNGRLQALRLLHSGDPTAPPARVQRAASGDWLVPVVEGFFPSRAEAEAYGLSDNKIAHMPGVVDDDAILRQIIQDIGAEVDLDGIGFSDEELRALNDDIAAADVAWKEFDESIGNGAPKGKQLKCPHCGETFEA